MYLHHFFHMQFDDKKYHHPRALARFPSFSARKKEGTEERREFSKRKRDTHDCADETSLKDSKNMVDGRFPVPVGCTYRSIRMHQSSFLNVVYVLGTTYIKIERVSIRAVSKCECGNSNPETIPTTVLVLLTAAFL